MHVSVEIRKIKMAPVKLFINPRPAEQNDYPKPRWACRSHWIIKKGTIYFKELQQTCIFQSRFQPHAKQNYRKVWLEALREFPSIKILIHLIHRFILSVLVFHFLFVQIPQCRLSGGMDHRYSRAVVAAALVIHPKTSQHPGSLHKPKLSNPLD